MKKQVSTRYLSVGTWVLLLALWLLASETGVIPANKLPSPLDVLRALQNILQNGYNEQSLWSHLGISFARLFFATVAAVITAIPLGLVSGYFPKVRAVIDSLVNFYRPLPPLSYYTLLIIWLGIDESSKITLLYLASFAPIYVAAVSAVGRVDRDYILGARTFGANNWQIFRTVIIPATLPEIFVGIRTAVGVAYTTLVSAEMIAARAGIGWMVFDAYKYFKTDVVVLGIIIMGVSGVLIDRFLRSLERHLVFWSGPKDHRTSKAYLLAIPVFILLLVPNFLGGQTFGDNPEKIRIGTIRIANDKTLAIEKDYIKDAFAKEGIEVEFLFFDSGTAANVALAAGEIEFAEMGYTNGVVALAQGLDVELVWIHDVLGKAEALVVQPDRGIKQIKDLTGKRLATPFSSTSHLSLLKALEKEGVNPSSVEILDMDTDAIVAAWQRGDIDGAYSWEPSLSHMTNTGKILVTSEDLAKEGIVTVNIDLANKTFAHDNPELVRLYLGALAQAGDLYRADPVQAEKAMAHQLAIPEEEAHTQAQGSLWLSPEEMLSPAYFGTEKAPGNFHNIFYETGIFLQEQQKINRLPSQDEVDSFLNTSYLEALVEGGNHDTSPH